MDKLTMVKKVILIFFLIAVLVLFWGYLSGSIFLGAFDKDFNDANPLTYWQYLIHFNHIPVVEKWLWISGGISAFLILIPFSFFLKSTVRSLYGDARFAKKKEIVKAGLFSDDGYIVGKLNNKYMVYGGSQHVLLSAPTRSGKGVGIVIPNLLSIAGSVVVLDIKQENWDITSGFRAKYGQKCFLFNPTAADYRSHKYNPLAYISDDKNFRIDDVQKIAHMLFPDKEGEEVIWTATPRALFVGIVLYLLETEGKQVTIGQALRESLVNGDGSEYFAKIIADRQSSDNPLSDVCVQSLKAYITISSENTRAGVITGYRSKLELWNNPLVDAATSGNDFDLSRVRKEKMSIYIGVTPDNLDRVAPLINLFFQQLIDLNTRELPNQNKELKYTCHLMMDEFTAIGRIGILAKGISYIAGYNLRMMPIIQSPSQLVEVYGKEAAETYTVNHALMIVFPPKAADFSTAKNISDWLGDQTVKGTSISKSKAFFGKKTPSESVSDQKRALMLPQEIIGLGQDKELIILENLAPVLAQKIKYYAEPTFVDRLKLVSPSLKALGKKIPSKKQLDDAILKGELSANVPILNVGQVGASAISKPASVSLKQPVFSPTRKSPEVVTWRTPEASDILKISSMSLDEFSIDFDSVVEPVLTGESEIDDEALLKYADDLSFEAGIKPIGDSGADYDWMG